MYLATAVRLILLLTQPPLYVAFQSTSDAQASWITLRDALASLDRSLAMQLQGVSMNGDERIVAEGDSSGGGGSGGAGSQIDTYYEANHVVLALPRSAVFTAAELHSKLSHFLEAPEFSQHRAKEKAIVPASFVFTLFFLYQLHAGGQPHADPVWHAWATYHDAVATGSDALFLWSEEELAELEEARMLESARDYRKQLEIQYDKLMAPLEAAFPDFFPPQQIGRAAFIRASAIATPQRLRVDGIDGEALVPLPLRHHPSGGSVRLEEVEVERLSPSGEVSSDRYVHLITPDGVPLRPGAELTVHRLSHERPNDELLLEGGYVWEELGSASVPMRVSLPADAASPSARERRDELLRQSGLNATQDFRLRHGQLPPKLLLWCRIMLATEGEIEAAATADSLRGPLSVATEESVSSNVFASLVGLRAGFEHDVEEDELILQGGLSPAAGGSRGTLPVRRRLAVAHRRLSKLVIEDSALRLSQTLEEAKAEAERLKSGSKSKYSTSKERRREEAARRKKEKQREEVRRRREAKEKERATAAER